CEPVQQRRMAALEADCNIGQTGPNLAAGSQSDRVRNPQLDFVQAVARWAWLVYLLKRHELEEDAMIGEQPQGAVAPVRQRDWAFRPPKSFQRGCNALWPAVVRS